MARFRTPIASPVQKRRGVWGLVTAHAIQEKVFQIAEKRRLEVPCPPPESAVNSAVTEKGTL